ncbi:MAG: 1-phosphofructokinase family hexose kinase [Anaerolineae bacterium]|nr:1-phosphofructokinase family hexose kinase [Anaerolineae bacterium]
MKTIVSLTMNPTLDKSTGIDHVVPDRKLRCQTLNQEPGGGGINVSRAIRKLGGDSVALYPAGGPNGETIERFLDEEGLDHVRIPVAGWSRESWMVLEEETGQQYRIILPGPHLKQPEWERCLEEIAKTKPEPDYVVASGSLSPGVPDDFFAWLAQWTRQAGGRFILDTSSKAALKTATQEGVYLIKPNLREFRELVGSELKDEAEQEVKAMAMVEAGQSDVVVVSLGAAGVILATQQGCERLRAPTVSIKSKVGAGDSTVAGIVLGLARDQTLRESILFGVAAGAAAVMTPGSELCRKEDTERLYQRMITSEES